MDGYLLSNALFLIEEITLIESLRDSKAILSKSLRVILKSKGRSNFYYYLRRVDYMNIVIDAKQRFEEMLISNQIKKEWSLLESYGIDAVINSAFEGYIEDDIYTAIICMNGVILASLYEGFVYNEIHVDSAYVSVNGDIILMSDEEDRILIIENKPINVVDFN